jgi:hypothetical protein
MTTLTKRTTVYLEPDLHKALRLKSVATSRSVSDLLNDAVRGELAVDAVDLATLDARKHAPAIGFEDFAKKTQAPRQALNELDCPFPVDVG